MKGVAWAVIGLVGGMMPAAAQPRLDSRTFSCREAVGIVRDRGPIVLHTGGPERFDKFVASRRLCGAREIAAPAAIPARDTPLCEIGWRCVNGYGYR